MINITRRTSVLVILAFGAVQATAQDAAVVCRERAGIAVSMCRVPVTKSYQIQAGFCPQQLVRLIPQCIAADGNCAGCGPYGIPPIYSAGNYVLIRQTPETHDRIATFLTDLGAYIPPKSSQ